jgi:hypothetical protein
VLLWLWLLPSAVFLALWEPGSAFHKLFIWPPVVLLIATYVSSRQLSQMQLDGIIALSVGMLSWNFAAFIFPHSHPSADPVLMLAQRIDRELPKGATVYFAVLGPDDWYLEYFAAGRNWQHATGTGKEIIERAKGTAGVVCLETTALQAIEQDQSAGRRVRDLMDPRRRWDLVNKQHNVRLECLKESR